MASLINFRQGSQTPHKSVGSADGCFSSSPPHLNDNVPMGTPPPSPPPPLKMIKFLVYSIQFNLDLYQIEFIAATPFLPFDVSPGIVWNQAGRII